MRPRASIVRSASSASRYPVRSRTASTIVGDGGVGRGRHQRLHRAAEALDRAGRRRREAGLLGMGGRLPERDAEPVCVTDEAGERGVADAAPGPVGDPRQRDGVERVVEHLQVGDRILDLRPLVEPRAADHLVGDPLADEHVLQHAALRVRAVDDCDLGRAVAAARSAPAISAATNRASECSSSVSTTRTGSPSPRSDQRFFSLRSRLCEMTRSPPGGSSSSSGSSARAGSPSCSGSRARTP